MNKNNRVYILSQFLNVPEEEISAKGKKFDSEIICGTKHYFVMKDDELLKYLKKTISIFCKLPFFDYSISSVVDALNIKSDDFLSYFLPDILLGKISKSSLTGEFVSGDILFEYLDKNNNFDEFIEKYSLSALEKDNYGEFFSYLFKERFGEYNIFCLRDDEHRSVFKRNILYNNDNDNYLFLCDIFSQK